jgi:chloramphenicol-sensitive protein RarD
MPLAGVVYALLAYGTWGVLPVYWKWLSAVPLAEVLAHRVAGTLVFTAVLLALLRRLPEVGEALRSRRERRALLASGSLIAVNWGVFIWAVGAGRIVETSLGYYLNPIVNVLLGMLILRERLSRAQGIAAGLAAAGVGVMLVSHGRLPWIALVLASSFGLYGLMHKLTHVRAIPALAIETGALAPLALGFLAFGTEPPGGALLTGSSLARALLLCAGPITALPLLWFGSAARRLPLSTLGLFQYLAPTLALLLAVFLYGEPFTRAHALAFLLIWGALALYTLDAFQASRESLARSSTIH